MALGLVLTIITGIDPGMVLSPTDLFIGLAAMNPEAVLSLGVLILIAIPLLRVISLGALFIKTQEWGFVLAVMMVLGALCLAITLGA